MGKSKFQISFKDGSSDGGMYMSVDETVEYAKAALEKGKSENKEMVFLELQHNSDGRKWRYCADAEEAFQAFLSGANAEVRKS